MNSTTAKLPESSLIGIKYFNSFGDFIRAIERDKIYWINANVRYTLTDSKLQNQKFRLFQRNIIIKCQYNEPSDWFKQSAREYKRLGIMIREQGWRSGESARLPPTWFGFDFRTRRHKWVGFVVGSVSLLRGFLSGFSSRFSSLHRNQHLLILIRSRIREPRVCQSQDCYVLPSLNKVDLFICLCRKLSDTSSWEKSAVLVYV